MSILTVDPHELTVDQRLDLIEELWSSLDDERNALPMLVWQREELARRIARHREHPEEVVTWRSLRPT